MNWIRENSYDFDNPLQFETEIIFDIWRHQNQKCDYGCPKMTLHDIPKMSQIGVKGLLQLRSHMVP